MSAQQQLEELKSRLKEEKKAWKKRVEKDLKSACKALQAAQEKSKKIQKLEKAKKKAEKAVWNWKKDFAREMKADLQEKEVLEEIQETELLLLKLRILQAWQRSPPTCFTTSAMRSTGFRSQPSWSTRS